jgi:Na+/pantothenate symporter
MRLLVSGVIVTAMLLGFVFVWIYLASQGQVPVIQAPLERVDPTIRLLALVVLAAIIAGVYFAKFPGARKSD